MRRVHDFRKSEPIGKKYEIEMVKAWPHLFELYEGGNEYDLNVLLDSVKKSLELKTEHGYTLQPGFPKPHVPRSTINIFIETKGNADKKGSLGGPFKAYEDLVDFYAHLFPHPADRVLFLFTDLAALNIRCYDLIARLPKWVRDNPIPVYNTEHVTLGYALPIQEFADLFVKIKLGDKNILKYLL